MKPLLLLLLVCYYSSEALSVLDSKDTGIDRLLELQLLHFDANEPLQVHRRRQLAWSQTSLPPSTGTPDGLSEDWFEDVVWANEAKWPVWKQADKLSQSRKQLMQALKTKLKLKEKYQGGDYFDRLQEMARIRSKLSAASEMKGSPYLLLKRKRQDKPIFLWSRHSACHVCGWGLRVLGAQLGGVS